MIRIIKCGLVLGLVLVAGRLYAEDATIEDAEAGYLRHVAMMWPANQKTQFVKRENLRADSVNIMVGGLGATSILITGPGCLQLR